MSNLIIQSVQLKNIKVLLSNSEETYCYTAKVYVNNKPAFEVKNSGHGGCDYVYPLKGFSQNDESILNEYFKKNCPASVYNFDGKVSVYFCNLESWCHNEVTKHLRKKDIKSMIKKKGTISLLAPNKEIFTYSVNMSELGYSEDPSIKAKQEIIKNQITKEQSGVILNFLSPEEFEKVIDDHFALDDNEFFPEFDAEGNCTNIPNKV